MALRLPPLNALRLFEAAGRHQSFKLAAEELHLTPSAVSHGIVSLERWLGVNLFDRGPRGISLTVAGQDYLPYVSEALSMIATGTQRLPSRRTDRRILVSVAPTFATNWLLPNLHKFHKQHPPIVVSIDTARRQLDFPTDGVDLAIRMGRGPWPGLASVKLMQEWLVPVCSPTYLSTLGADGAARLAGVTLLHVVSATEDWAAWLEAAGIGDVDLSRGFQFDTARIAFDAAASGLGIAIGRKPLVDRDLASGRLVRALDPVVPAATAYWLVSSEAAENRPEIAAFKRWLVAETAQL
ncbi:transcriptional regulator GcvA [Rhodospirillaceae bacterium SYSU D60014]|uniref:transcriptional regulator GcvA n=1 Tax=Virgifigura deserti TaxID=2268457 RepID=UPI000E6721CB